MDNEKRAETPSVASKDKFYLDNSNLSPETDYHSKIMGINNRTMSIRRCSEASIRPIISKKASAKDLYAGDTKSPSNNKSDSKLLFIKYSRNLLNY